MTPNTSDNTVTVDTSDSFNERKIYAIYLTILIFLTVVWLGATIADIRGVENARTAKHEAKALHQAIKYASKGPSGL